MKKIMENKYVENFIFFGTMIFFFTFVILLKSSVNKEIISKEQQLYLKEQIILNYIEEKDIKKDINKITIEEFKELEKKSNIKRKLILLNIN